MNLSTTLLLIGITAVISLLAFNNTSLYTRFLMNPYMVFRKRQYWRLVTSGFIHANYMHLGFNMFTFYFFGHVVEQRFGQLFGHMGTVLYVLFYLSAIVISDLPIAWKKRDQIHYNSLGASGGVSAMVFASILYFPINDLCLYGFLCLPGFIFGILYVIYSYFSSKNARDHVNHDAHLFGALYGLVFAIVVYPHSLPEFLNQVLNYQPFSGF